METISPRKFIVLVIVVSVASSAVTAMVTVSVLTGENPRQVVERIIERTAPPASPATEKEISERILRQDELVVGVVKRASPAVVSIVATKDVPVVEQYFVDPFGNDPFFRQFFGNGGGFQIPQYRQKGTEKRPVASGTGFVVSADGLIVTNRHVVADTAAEYTAFFNDGTKAAAKVLARDSFQDIAILKVERAGLATVALGNAGSIQIGQTVIAIGNALGEFSNTVSVGVVSGLHRTITASGGGSSEELQELIQTDAAINPGNSGGPLLNLRGEVIGINVAMASGAENIGFAIPANYVLRDVESVKQSGRIAYPFLGVRYVMLTADIQAREKLSVGEGAYITGGEGAEAITKGSPAEKAGLRPGDIITAFDGKAVSRDHPLAERIREQKPGDVVRITVRRGSETLTLSVTLEERK